MPDKRDLEPLLTTQQNQLGLTMSASDSLDTKALAILGINVAVLIFIAQASVSFRWWGYVFALGSYILSLLLNFLAIWPRNYIGAGANLDDYPEYISMASSVLVLQLLADTRLAIKTNSAINSQRLRLCLISIALTVLGSFTLFVILWV